MQGHRLSACFFAAALLVSHHVVAQNPALDDLAMQFTVEPNVPVPMRDGVILRADIIRPRQAAPHPTLVYRTPYGKRNALREFSIFRKSVQRGYAVLLQDVRGRYESEGDFFAYLHEGKDGYDTIEWAARQPWSDGNVGTFGLSYPGAVQWLAAIETPPHLKAMAPFMTFSSPRNFFYSGGVFDGSWLEWIWANIAPDIRARKNLPGPRSHEDALATWNRDHSRMQSTLPLSQLPDLKEVAPFYYEWLKHSAWDSWWDWAELRDKYPQVHAAVLNLSGWYDEAYGPDGATTNLNGLLAARAGRADLGARTIIGPWGHGVENTETPKAGDRQFPQNAVIDYDDTVLRWMDHHVRGIDNGIDREKPVRLFIMGSNVWRDEDSWPLLRARNVEYFLSTGNVPNLPRHGLLSTNKPHAQELPSEFVSDPDNPLTDPYEVLGGHDYRRLEQRSDVLFFDSEPLTQDTEVTGPITADIFVSVDAPDMDLWGRLLDVAPDGRAWNLMSPGLDVQRLSYRNHAMTPELLTPGEIYEIKLDELRTANVFLKGHRIRIQVSAAFFPHFSRNLQTGLSEMSSSKTRKAKVSIYHDSQHPSRVLLPVVPNEK
jgi:putative CocE/NonD family hydrolase